MKNILCFELLMPSNSELLETTATHDKKKILTSVRPLKKIDEDNPVGCFFPNILLESSATYELFLSGLVNELFLPGVDAKLEDVITPSICLTLGEKKIDRIQDVSGKIINFFWRFKTAAASASGRVEQSKNNLFLASVVGGATAGTKHYPTLVLDNSACYLRQIFDTTPECFYRRGQAPRAQLGTGTATTTSAPYSMMHTLFEEVYVLNFNHEPHKWIECKKRMKAVGIQGTRVGMSLEDELIKYNSWRALVGSGTRALMSAETWCVSRQIVRILDGLQKKSVFFLSANSFFYPKFETILYDSLLSKPLPKLFSLTPPSSWSGRAENFLGMGIAAEFYKTFVAKFESSPVPAEKIFTDLCTEYAVLHHTIGLTTHEKIKNTKGEERETQKFEERKEIKSDPYRKEIIGGDLYQKEIIWGNFHWGAKGDASPPISKKKHYITILVHMPRRFFFSPVFQEFVQLLRKQNYPYWNCVLLTEAAADLFPNLFLEDGGEEGAESNDERFLVVEKKDAGGMSLQDIFGLSPPTKYLTYLTYLSPGAPSTPTAPETFAIFAALKDVNHLSRHVYAHTANSVPCTKSVEDKGKNVVYVFNFSSVWNTNKSTPLQKLSAESILESATTSKFLFV